MARTNVETSPDGLLELTLKRGGSIDGTAFVELSIDEAMSLIAQMAVQISKKIGATKFNHDLLTACEIAHGVGT